jgi:hypothetical protein
MKCNEVAEFISALYDGEKIPREVFGDWCGIAASGQLE